jgi:uncharacterized protein (DUF433 family)
VNVINLWMSLRASRPYTVVIFNRSCYNEGISTEVKVMSDKELLDRIAIDPRVMVGKPLIRGTRLTVEFILGLLAHGSAIEDITSEYKGLTKEDIQACLLFATKSLEDSSFLPLAGNE